MSEEYDSFDPYRVDKCVVELRNYGRDLTISYRLKDRPLTMMVALTLEQARSMRDELDKVLQR